MNYLRKIALRAYYKTATFIQVVADYEGEERRKQERRLSPRDSDETTETPAARRTDDNLNPIQRFNQRNRLPVISEIKDGDLVIKIDGEGSRIHKKDLSILKEFGEESSTPAVFAFIQGLIDQGILKPENNLYYDMSEDDINTATLKNARPMFELYMSTKGGK